MGKEPVNIINNFHSLIFYNNIKNKIFSNIIIIL